MDEIVWVVEATEVGMVGVAITGHYIIKTTPFLIFNGVLSDRHRRHVNITTGDLNSIFCTSKQTSVALDCKYKLPGVGLDDQTMVDRHLARL